MTCFESVDGVNASVGGIAHQSFIAFAGEHHISADLIVVVEGRDRLFCFRFAKAELRKMDGPSGASGEFSIFLDECSQIHVRSGELLQRLQDFGVFRLLSQLVDFHPSDLALLIHNEHRAVVDKGYRVSCGRKDAIIRRGFGVGPTVRREGELKAAQRFLESDMAENRVSADAHDLGVEVSKAGEVRLEC